MSMLLQSRALPKALSLALAISTALTAVPAPAQPATQVVLPALGEAASDDFNVATEKRLGEQVMREIRRDPDYLEDPVLLAYLQSIWQPLVAAARARGDITPDIDRVFPFEAFLVRDRSVNAFALPGGYVGVHAGLIAMTTARDELAAVLAHELSHVTQRHIARGLVQQSRASTLGMAAMLLGVIAAGRARNADMAQAAIVGGQAAAVQSQLNFSRDMEREADRNGYALLDRAGYSVAGMSAMFDKLGQSNRHNDSGQYPYLRSHPLTAERIAEARARASSAESVQGSGGASRTAALTVNTTEHALMQARARVLMDASVPSLRRWQGQDALAADTPWSERLGGLYASALASSQLRDFARAEAALAKAQALLATSPRAEPGAQRAVALLGAQLALAQGDGARAAQRVAAYEHDDSRELLLLRAQAAVSGNATALRGSAEALQTWLADHRDDAAAWTQLAQCADRLGLKLRAVRAEAESRSAIGDLQGAIDRLRGGQRLARERSGALPPADFIEASVIDARLRELMAQRRQQMAEARGERGPREPE